MSDITQKVQILIGGDATQAKKVIQEVENELKASKQRQQNQTRSQINEHGNMGRDLADRFGREYNRAQDRWLGVASNGFRRYGGTVGAIIAEVIEQFDSVERAARTGERLERRWGEGPSKGGFGAAHIASETAGAAGSLGGAKTISNELKGKKMDFFQNNREVKVADTPSLQKGSLLKDVGVAVGIGAAIGFVAYGIEKWVEWREKVKQFNQEFGLTNAEAKKFVAIGSELNNEKGVVKYLTNLVDLLEKAKNGAPEAVKGLKELGILSPYVTTGQANKTIEDKLKDAKTQGEKDLIALRAKMDLDQADTITGGPSDSITGKFRSNPTVSAVAGGMVPTTPLEVGMVLGPEYTKEIRMLLAKQAAKLRGDDELQGRIADQLADLYKDALEFEKDKIAIVQAQIDDLKEKQEDELDLDEYAKRNLEIAKKELEIHKLTLDSDKKFAEEVDKENKRITDAKKETADLVEQIRDINDAEAKKDRARADNDKFGISDLANAKGVNPRAVGAAKDVQNLEEQAKIANANGRPQDAARLRNQANQIRARLGAAGIIKSGEFDRKEYPFKPDAPKTLRERLGIDATAYTANSEFKDGYGIKPIYGAENQKVIRGVGPMDNPNKVLRPFRLNDRIPDRGINVDGSAPKTLEGYFAANGYLPVKPSNG